MFGYLLGRILATIPVVVLISVLVFLLIHAAPGDPADLLLSDEASPEDIAEARHRWGLDQPIYIQYLRFLANVASGDMGTSFRYADPVIGLIGERLPATIELAIASLLIAVAIGIPLGVWAGAKPNSWADNLGSVVGFFGISMPSFWLGIMLILVVSVQLGWLPSMDRSPYSLPVAVWRSLAGEPDVLLRWARHIVLPAITLGAFFTALIARMTRTEVLENLGRPFVLMAKAKGQSALGVLWRHVLPNSLIPIVTIAGVQIGQLLGGALVTEAVFTWPGMGRLIIDAIFARDFPVIQTAVFVYACIWVSINFLVDVLYLALDPRVTLE